jgi:hypothetical protein
VGLVQLDGARGNAGGLRGRSVRVGYKNAPDLAARIALCDQTRGRRSQAWEEAKPELLSNIQAKFRPILAAGAGRVGGLNQARVIEYLIGDDMRLFLLASVARDVDATWLKSPEAVSGASRKSRPAASRRAVQL